MRRVQLLSLLLAAAICSDALGDTSEVVLYQSGTMGSPGQSGGTVVAPHQYLGTRFQLARGAMATSIGGHFRGSQNNPGDIFAAIIRLTDLNDFPNSISPLNTSDVVATTVFTPPLPSADVRAPIGPVDLSPGTYALLFGSGQFGATGEASAAFGNNDVIGLNEDFFYYDVNGAHYIDGGFAQDRFVVWGIVPEPSSALFCAVLGGAMASLHRRSGS